MYLKCIKFLLYFLLPTNFLSTKYIWYSMLLCFLLLVMWLFPYLVKDLWKINDIHTYIHTVTASTQLDLTIKWTCNKYEEVLPGVYSTYQFCRKIYIFPVPEMWNLIRKEVIFWQKSKESPTTQSIASVHCLHSHILQTISCNHNSVNV